MNESQPGEIVDRFSVRRDRIGLALLLAMTFLAFLPALFADFVYDDHHYVAMNPWIRDWSNLAPLLTSMEANSTPEIAAVFWRPLRNLSYLIDHTLSGGSPFWFHLVNIAWHLVAVAGVFFLARALDLRFHAALFASAIFALHPAQVESVAWVKERDGVMAGALLLWALVAARGPTWLHSAAAFALAVLSMLSKENAVVAAPLFLIVAAVEFVRGERERRFILRQAALILSAAIAAAIFLYIRSRVVGMTAQVEEYPGGTFGTTMWTMAGVFLRYLGLVVAPLNMQIDYSHLEPARGFSLLSAAGVILLLILPVTAALSIRKRPLVALGILWFLVALLPVSNLVPTMQWMAVRFLYLPLAGIALAIGSLFGTALAKHQSYNPCSPVFPVVGFLVALVLAVLTLLETLAWQNDAALWTTAFDRNPRNPVAMLNYARIQNERGAGAQALDAMRDFPFDRLGDSKPHAWLTLARAQELSGDLPAALITAETAAARFPAFPPLLDLHGRLLAISGNLDAAIARWEQSLAIDAFGTAALQNLARAYEMKGELEKSREVAERLRRVQTLPRSEW